MNTKTTEWKMVRPTLEMISAGSNAQVAASSDDEFDQPDDYINVWRDAPTPQAKPCERCAELEAEAKARKQAQADLETYKGRCTDLEHQNERLTRCLKKANEHTEHFEREYYLRGDVIEQQAEQLAAAQKVIALCEGALACKYDSDLRAEIKAAIAEQKEGEIMDECRNRMDFPRIHGGRF